MFQRAMMLLLVLVLGTHAVRKGSWPDGGKVARLHSQVLSGGATAEKTSETSGAEKQLTADASNTSSFIGMEAKSNGMRARVTNAWNSMFGGTASTAVSDIPKNLQIAWIDGDALAPQQDAVHPTLRLRNMPNLQTYETFYGFYESGERESFLEKMGKKYPSDGKKDAYVQIGGDLAGRFEFEKLMAYEGVDFKVIAFPVIVMKLDTWQGSWEPGHFFVQFLIPSTKKSFTFGRMKKIERLGLDGRPLGGDQPWGTGIGYYYMGKKKVHGIKELNGDEGRVVHQDIMAKNGANKLVRYAGGEEGNNDKVELMWSQLKPILDEELLSKDQLAGKPPKTFNHLTGENCGKYAQLLMAKLHNQKPENAAANIVWKCKWHFWGTFLTHISCWTVPKPEPV